MHASVRAREDADAAQLAATERTAVWLDQLTATGALTAEQRARIAAEDGAPSLARVLRRAELAGHDPRQTLADAIADGPLTGAKNLTNVLYARITDGGTRRFDPVGSTYADWIPRTDNPEWNDYLAALAAAADQRAAELGRAAADDAPAWAVEALGPVPDDLDRARRRGRSAPASSPPTASCAATTTRPTPSAPRPKAGQVEQYAAYRAAWRALGRPEVDRATHELSDGQLRMRVRALAARTSLGTPLRRPRTRRHPPGRRPPPPDRRPAPRRSRRRHRRRRAGPAAPARPPRPRPSPTTLDQRAAAAAAARRRPRRLARPHRRHPRRRRGRRGRCSPNATPTTPSPNPSSPPRNGSPPTAPPSPTTSAPRDHRGRHRRRRRRARPSVDRARRRADADARRPPRGRRGRAPPGAGGRRARAPGRRGDGPVVRARSGRSPRSPPATRHDQHADDRRTRRASSPAGTTTTSAAEDRTPSTRPPSSRRQRAEPVTRSAGQRAAGVGRERARALVPPRPPQRRPDALAPPRLMLDEIRPADVELLRRQVLRLDQLLVGASTAAASPATEPATRRPVWSCTTAPASHRHVTATAAGYQSGSAPPGLLAVEPLRLDPQRAELRPRHAEVPDRHAGEQRLRHLHAPQGDTSHRRNRSTRAGHRAAGVVGGRLCPQGRAGRGTSLIGRLRRAPHSRRVRIMATAPADRLAAGPVPGCVPPAMPAVHSRISDTDSP